MAHDVHPADPWPGSAKTGKAATGYSIVLPPGWRRIPVRSGTEQAIRAAVKEAFAVLPRDAPVDRVGPHRLELERRLKKMAREARRTGGIDLCLPIVPVYGTPLAASFIVSELALPLAADATEVLTVVAAGNDRAQPVIVDSSEGLRVERIGEPAPDSSIEVASRRVTYVVAAPGNPGRWLVVTFSTLGGGDPEDQIALLLTSLFDAMMSTFRWGRTNQG